MGSPYVARRKRPSLWLIFVLGATIAMAPFDVAAAPAMDDPAAGADVDRCQRALAASGRAVASSRLAALGRCVARVFACEQQGGRAASCLEKARKRCAKDVAKAGKSRTRAVAKAEKSCRDVSADAVIDAAGLGFGRLVRACLLQRAPLVDSAQLVACVERRHACTADEMLTLQYPRARAALEVAGTDVTEDGCFGTVTTPEAFPVGKRGVACLKAATQGASALAVKTLGGLQACLTAATACVQRKASDPKCLAKAAKKCVKTDAKAGKIIVKLGRTLEKRCDGVEFASLSSAFGLPDVASACAARGADVDSLFGWSVCLARAHRCLAEDLLAQEVPRAGELLEELDTSLAPQCAAGIEALPGRDQTVLVGDSLVLTAGAGGTDEEPTFVWTLRSAPAGSAVALSDPTAVAQSITPDVVGDFELELVARAGGRQSDPAVVIVTAAAEPVAPPALVAVAGVTFGLSQGSVVDPESDVRIEFEGPVDPATLTAATVTITANGTPVTVTLAFDASTNALRVVPDAPLAPDASFRLDVVGVGATTSPANVVPFSTTFLTPPPNGSIEGVVVDPERNPLSMVRIAVGASETFTGANGRFRLEGVAPGPHILDVDPSTVEDGEVVYTPLGYPVEVRTGLRPSSVGRPIVLTVVDTTTEIAFPSSRVLTSPKMPGFRVDFSASTVTNPNGTPYVGPLTLSPVAPTDVPMPFPGASVAFATVQPGGLRVDPPAVITLPLPIAMDPGDEIDLWAFDHAIDEWVNYGLGFVDASGTTATSAPGSGLPFTGWHSLVTRREVTRDLGDAPAAPLPARPLGPAQGPIGLEGRIFDADGFPLHGVRIDALGSSDVYTDYTNGTFDGVIAGHYLVPRVVVGFNVYVNGMFTEFEPRDVELCATASDLLGDIFAECTVVPIAPLANTMMPDGNLQNPIEPGPVTLSDYSAVDSNGSIHLHRDLADDSLSHEIRRRDPLHVLALSARYQAEVRAVSRKLASMGFREDPLRCFAGFCFGAQFLQETSQVTLASPIERAIQLFQALWFMKGLSSAHRLMDRVLDEDELRALNGIDGVIWTTQDPYPTGYRYSSGLGNRFFHPRVPPELVAIATKSRITSGTPALGGPRQGAGGFKGHNAGSEVDGSWIQHNGQPGWNNFYRPLSYRAADGRTVRIRATVSKAGVPAASEEWTEADRTSGITDELDAIVLGKTWTVVDIYDRARTQTFVDQINQRRQPNKQRPIFNDPQIRDVVRVVGHANHVHFGFFFEHKDVAPPGTDGAPAFALVAPGTLPSSFMVESAEPGQTTEPVDPAAPIRVGFTEPVDPTTLTPESAQLLAWASGQVLSTTMRLLDEGRTLELIPNEPLPEGVDIALELSPAITSTTGSPLAFDERGPIVTSFTTGLSASVVRAAFDREPIQLTRADLSDARLVLIGEEDGGGSRDVTDAVTDVLLQFESGRLLEPALDDVSRLERVFNGRGILHASLSNGLDANVPIEVDLVATPTGHLVVQVGEPVAFQFGERVDTNDLSVVSAEAVDESNEATSGSVSVDEDGRTLRFMPDAPLPRLVPLTMEVVLAVTDPLGESIEVVVPVGFSVVGTGADDVDTDGDGLSDPIEDALGDCVDKTLVDTDGDGTSDADEDCDDDGLTNLFEATQGLNPGTRDTDGDGILDPIELNLGCDPRSAETTMVVGRVVDQGAAGVTDASVRALGAVAASDATGAFTIPNVPACPTRTFRVVASREGTPPLEGVSGSVSSIVGDVVDVGDIIAEAVTAPRYPDGHFVGDSPDYVALADVDNDGKLDAISVNSGDLSVLLGRGDGTFDPEIRIPAAGPSGRFIATAHLDDDGDLDVVTSVTGGLSILLGNGDGTFADAVFVGVSGNPNGVAAADMNGDTILDLVAASDNAGVVVLLGNGDGTFQTELKFDSDRDQTAIAVGFFNDDAALDVVTGGRAFINQSVGEVAVLLGNGDGTLQAAQEFRTMTHRVHDLLVTDLDGDTRLDIVTGSFQKLVVPDGPILGAVLRGNGDGTFQTAEPFTLDESWGGGSMALGQLTDDENVDLLVANGFLDLSLLAGNGDGTFQPDVSIPRGLDPYGLAVGDINGDGVDDIVNSDTFDEQVWSLLGNGDGTFRVAGQTRLEVLFESGSGTARRYATADFDGDGHLDLVAAGHRRRLSVIPGKGDFFFEPHVGLEALPTARTADVDVGDFDGNGTIDAVALGAEEVVVFPGNGDGTFGAGVHTNLGLGTSASDAEEIVATHLNDDGALDLVATLGFNDQVVALLGNGDGTFQAPVILTGVDRPMGLAVADLESDGAADIIVAPLPDLGLGIYRGNGDGTFGPVRFLGEANFIQVAAVDLNADTIVDLVASGYPAAEDPPYEAVVAFLGNGDGTFQRGIPYGTDICPEGMIASDLTGDDLPDVVTANCGSDTLSFFVGNGDGTLQPQMRIGVGQPDQLIAGDFGGSPAPDLVVGTEFVDVGIVPHR